VNQFQFIAKNKKRPGLPQLPLPVCMFGGLIALAFLTNVIAITFSASSSLSRIGFVHSFHCVFGDSDSRKSIDFRSPRGC